MRVKIVLGLSAFLFFTSISHVSADFGPNLITNPSFESGTTLPTGWEQIKGNAQNIVKFVYPVAGYDLAKAARIEITKYVNGDVFWMPTNAAVTAGKKYEFSGFYRASSSAIVIATYLNKSNVAVSYVTLGTVASSDTWKQFQSTTTVPTGATQVRIQFVVKAVGFLEVDANSLQEVITGVVVLPPATTTPPVVPPPPPTPPVWEGMVTFSFDDSWISQYTVALPILQAAGMKGTFYLTTQPIQEKWDDFMTAAQVKDLAKKGHEIAGHTITHPHLPTLSVANLTKELVDSKKYLEGLIGAKVTAFAYPYGEFNAAVKTAVKSAGYTTGRGVQEEKPNLATSDKFDLQSPCILKSTPFATIKKSIDTAKSKKQWYILCFHEIKTGGDEYSVTQAQFQQIVDYVKSTNIKTVTIKEGLALMVQ